MIRDCGDWKDRTWQQIAGVTLREVRATSRLWTWQENDLQIWGYPLDKEAILQGKRKAAAEGGKASGKSRRDGVAISKVFPAGTILITIAANIGYTGILEFDSAAPDSLIGLTPNDTVSPEFLNFYLRTQQPVMDRMAPKGTQKNINIEFLKGTSG